ncbi:MAG: TonB-dependent receptor [Candidatus Solibacter usitatus]|nr:TonB-dependent receptor [Candidatus Solibacter usitatus]
MMQRCFSVISVLCLLATAGMGQQDARGTIVGAVTDASGAVVAGAQVDVVNKAMGTKISLKTNDSGLYQAPFLIPGKYQVKVEVAGFKKYLRDELEVRVNDRLEVDIKLEVGAAEQSVTVTGETPLLATETASLGAVIDGRRVSELPIPHGNPYFLIGLAAGVSFTRDPRLDRPFEPTHIVGYTMDGTRANRSDITIDGAVATATANAGEVISSYVPPADIVQEFKVQTATFDASFGQTEGGVTNISLKSGTNQLHGTMYYSNMTPGLFANDFFANRTSTPRPDFYYHRWGASAGGPVWLPKLYDGRNKTFFMWGYEGIEEARPRNNGTPTVPSEAMKGGDFSALLRVNANYQVYNPWTRRSVAGGRYQQDPFAGNIIPASLFNPVSKKVLDTYYPKPLQAGNADGTQNYLRPELMEHAAYYTHSVRVDHTLTDKQRIFARVSWYDRNSDYNNFFNNLTTGEWFLFSSRAGVFDHVYALNSTTVLNLRYGYNRFIRGTNANPEQRGFDLTKIGLPASYNNLISADMRRFPRFDITGYQGTGIGGEYRPNDTHSFNATLQKATGKHALKGGMEWRAYRETDTFFANNQTGQFNFDATWTRGPLDNSTAAPGSLGQSVASFLLGLPASSSFVARSASYAEQSLSWGFFLHDDWKVTDRLTLNLGLRWEFENALTERFNRSVRGFDTAYTQPFSAAAQAKYALNQTPEVPASSFSARGGLTFPNVGGQPRSLYNTPKELIMPRLGAAYRLNNRTVLRSGYGVFYGFLGQRRGDVIQSGFSRNTSFVPTQDNGLTFLSTLSNPWPNGILDPVGAGQGPQTFVGNSISFYNENPVAPKMQRWQFGVQRELGSGFVMDLTYVGNLGSDIEIGQNLNATPQKYLSHSLLRDTTTINYLSANLPNPFQGLLPAGASGTFTGANLSRERLLRPYPEFDAISQSRFDGKTWYHSMQLSVDKRFARGFTLSGGYTFSKYMQMTETFQADDPTPVRVISDLDRPHRFVVSGIWELPFGKGRHFGNSMPAAAEGILGGWQLAGVYTFQSGSPIGFGNLIFIGDVKNIALPADQQKVERWFNTDAGFEKNSTLQLASNVRWFAPRFGFIRADQTNNYDLSVIKNTRFKERYNVQIKGEFLNAMNHPLFPAPNTTPTGSTFGQAVASTQANYPRRIQLNIKFLF